jgi:cytochrome c-type biogenesis protein CcmH/NrfG
VTQNAWEQKSVQKLPQKTTSALNGQIKTPYLKNQLQGASHSLDDAEAALEHALQADPTDKGMWINLAQFNLQMATQFRQKVQEYFDKYGPNIQEIGGG